MDMPTMGFGPAMEQITIGALKWTLIILRDLWWVWVPLVLLAILRVWIDISLARRQKARAEQAEIEQRVRVESAVRASVAPAQSPSEALESLSSLWRSGALSDAEWQRAKESYLGRGISVTEQSISEITRLYSLFRSGAISESEYNSKKWDLLIRA